MNTMPKWQIYLLLIFATVVAIIMLHAGLTLVNAFNAGQIQVSAPTQNTITLMLLGIVNAAGLFVVAWFQKKTSDLSRRQNQAAIQQSVHEAKEEIKETLKNGGGDAIAQKTASAIAPLILEGDRRNDIPNDTGERRRVSDAENLDRR